MNVYFFNLKGKLMQHFKNKVLVIIIFKYLINEKELEYRNESVPVVSNNQKYPAVMYSL